MTNIMSITEIQNSIIRQILNINDISVLKNISKDLNRSKTITFNENKESLTPQQYHKEIDELINEMETGADKGKTTEEVFKNISDTYSLE